MWAAYADYIGRFAPKLTGIADIAGFADGDRVAQFYYPQTAATATMFGGRSFMADGMLLVSAQRDGGLLVRVGADRHDELVRRPGATRGVMGAGREMSAGWIAVAPGAIDSDDQLAFRIEAARAHHRSIAGR